MWWVVLAVVAAFWAATAYVGDAHWPSIGLGFGTGAMLACWAFDMTGGKVPDSWRRDPPSGGATAEQKRIEDGTTLR